MGPLLEYATKRIVELESMLLVDAEESVWLLVVVARQAISFQNLKTIF